MYHEQTSAVVGYYKDSGSLIINVNADQPIEEVTASIFAELDKLNVQVG